MDQLLSHSNATKEGRSARDNKWKLYALNNRVLTEGSTKIDPQSTVILFNNIHQASRESELIDCRLKTKDSDEFSPQFEDLILSLIR